MFEFGPSFDPRDVPEGDVESQQLILEGLRVDQALEALRQKIAKEVQNSTLTNGSQVDLTEFDELTQNERLEIFSKINEAHFDRTVVIHTYQVIWERNSDGDKLYVIAD
jgi:hypothetical protein